MKRRIKNNKKIIEHKSMKQNKQNNILGTVNMYRSFKEIREMYKPSTIVFANGLGVVISLENNGIINVNNNGKITIYDASGFDNLPFCKLIDYIFTDKELFII